MKPLFPRPVPIRWGARQYCDTLGKATNCQVAVSLHWPSEEAGCPILWRLYLPKEWLEDTARGEEVKLVPGKVYQTERELALEVIDQALARGFPALPLGADYFHGNDFGFRQTLRERHLSYTVQVEPSLVVWTTGPHPPLPPPNQRGRPRKYPPLQALPSPGSLRKVA